LRGLRLALTPSTPKRLLLLRLSPARTVVSRALLIGRRTPHNRSGALIGARRCIRDGR